MGERGYDSKFYIKEPQTSINIVPVSYTHLCCRTGNMYVLCNKSFINVATENCTLTHLIRRMRQQYVTQL